jgi:hypothetical protein
MCTSHYMERFLLLLSMFHCWFHNTKKKKKKNKTYSRVSWKKKERVPAEYYILTVTMATCFATECSPHTVITFYIHHHPVQHWTFAMLCACFSLLSVLCYVLCYDKLSRTCVSSATLFDTVLLLLLLMLLREKPNVECVNRQTNSQNFYELNVTHD